MHHLLDFYSFYLYLFFIKRALCFTSHSRKPIVIYLFACIVEHFVNFEILSLTRFMANKGVTIFVIDLIFAVTDCTNSMPRLPD